MTAADTLNHLLETIRCGEGRLDDRIAAGLAIQLCGTLRDEHAAELVQARREIAERLVAAAREMEARCEHQQALDVRVAVERAAWEVTP